MVRVDDLGILGISNDAHQPRIRGQSGAVDGMVKGEAANDLVHLNVKDAGAVVV